MGQQHRDTRQDCVTPLVRVVLGHMLEIFAGRHGQQKFDNTKKLKLRISVSAVADLMKIHQSQLSMIVCSKF